MNSVHYVSEIDNCITIHNIWSYNCGFLFQMITNKCNCHTDVSLSQFAILLEVRKHRGLKFCRENMISGSFMKGGGVGVATALSTSTYGWPLL